jgi:uncharacterized protein (TIGR03066 family)
MSRSSEEERRERIRRYNQREAAAPKSDAGEEGSPTPQGAAAPASSKGRLALILLVCLLGSLAVSYVVFKFFIPASVPNELVGTWQVTEGPLRGATLEFRHDGAVIATLTIKGKKEVTTQSAKVDGKKLFLTTKDPDTKKDDTVIQTILILTDDELVIRDEDKRTYRMKRVRN